MNNNKRVWRLIERFLRRDVSEEHLQVVKNAKQSAEDMQTVWRMLPVQMRMVTSTVRGDNETR
jgi:hypothetical protein